MDKIPLIVIGASAGGLESLAAVLKNVSPKIPAPILGVIHIGAHDAKFPDYFRSRSALPVRYARDGEPIMAGRVLLAPPDRHLIVERGHVHLGRGPKENHTRPAIDPLFRSAAEIYGPLVIGAILTGFLTDGTAGLWEVKRRGGVAIVQDPDEAEVPSMPLSALRHVKVDHCVPVAELGRLLDRLAATALKTASQVALMSAGGGGGAMEYTADTPVALTCPDCGGALKKTTVGSYTQFRCHIGHVFGTREAAQAQFDALEATLEQALRLLNERKEFCREAARDAQSAEAWNAAALQSEVRFKELTKLLEDDWTRPELAEEAAA